MALIARQFYATLVLVVAVTFIVGMVFGRSLSSAQVDEVTKVIKNSELSAESFVIEETLFETFAKDCGLAKKRLDSLSSQLRALGVLLGSDTAETDLGAEIYNVLKRKFHLMQIKTYLLYYRLRPVCKLQTPVVLFYYSKQDPYSKEQGRILDALVVSHNLTVFAIEVNYSNELVFLENYYDISSAPSLVINFEQVKPHLVSAEDIIGSI